MSEYFLEPKFSEGKVKVELDLSNYATNVYLKDSTGTDTSKFANKVDLAGLKSNVDKLDFDKLKNLPTNLKKLKSRVDKLYVDKLVPVLVDKITDITNLATKSTFNVKINEVKGEIPSITNLATTAAVKAKINEVKDKISNTTNLASTTALTAVKNKITNVTNLVKKN